MGPFDQQIEPAQETQQIYQNQPTQQQEIKYAGFWIRVFANMVDGMIVSVAMGLLLLMFFQIMGAKGLILAYIVWIFSYFAYFIFTTTKYQGTPGKKLLGIKVLTGGGERATAGKIALRELVGKMVSGMIFSIGYMMAGFTERKRALHDMIADTVVVYENPTQKIKSGVVALIIIGGMIVSGVEGYAFTSIAKNMIPNQISDQIEQEMLYDSDSFSNNLQQADEEQPSANEPEVEIIFDNNSVSNIPKDEQSLPASETVNMPAQQMPAKNQATTLNNNDLLDMQAKNKMETIMARLMLNFSKNKTFSGFVLDDDLAMPVSNSTCETRTKLDIHPNGQRFVIHRPICATALTQSYCLESENKITTQTNTEFVKSTYSCQ